MLAGQMMIDVAYATGTNELPIAEDGADNTIDFSSDPSDTGDTSESGDGNAVTPPEGSSDTDPVTPSEGSSDTDPVTPSEGGSESQGNTPSGDSGLETGDTSQGSGNLPVAGEDGSTAGNGDPADAGDDSASGKASESDMNGIMILSDDDMVPYANGDGGLSVTVSTNPPEGTTVKDGDKFTFSVVIQDTDLSTEPNIHPGDQLKITIPKYLKPADVDGWLTNCQQYFTDIVYNSGTNTVTMKFKEFDGQNQNIQLNFSMVVDTIGYDGNGKDNIGINIGDSFLTGTGVTVDTGSGTGTGDGESNTKPITKLVKQIWSNAKQSEGGGLVIRDPTKPIGYSVEFGVNLASGDVATLSDDLSNGNLLLCDLNGDTTKPTFSILVGGNTYTGNFDSGASFSDTPVGTIAVARSGSGFSVVCTNSTGNAVGPVSIVVKYYAIASANADFFTNKVNLALSNGSSSSQESTIRKYDNAALYASKSIGESGAEFIDIDESTAEVTFCITLTQYGIGSVLKTDDIVVYDLLEDCFTFVPGSVDLTQSGGLFDLRTDSENTQKLLIVKKDDSQIPAGVYKVFFTVNVDPGKLDFGETATNTVGNTVYIRRMAKLTISKNWLNKEDGTSVNHGLGARFVLYKDGNPIANTGELKDANSYTLYIKAADLAEGPNICTLKEEIDEANGYQTAHEKTIIITKTVTKTDEIITFENDDGEMIVAVDNEPDSGMGSLTFRKYGDNGDLLDGGIYELHRIENGIDTIFQVNNKDTFNTSEGVITISDLPYGTYYVKEIKAPPGYVLESEATGTVELTKSAAHPSVSLKNKRFTEGKIEILKVHVVDPTDPEKNMPLKGVEFTIEKPDKTRQTVTTDTYGLACFTGLSAGEYRIAETGPLAGYTGFEGPIWVTIDENGTSDVKATAAEGLEVTGKTIKITWNNIQQFGSVRLKKTDPNGSPLAGAEFTLYNSQNVVVETKKTGEDGIVLFTDLAYGTYTLKETKAPVGYVISDDLARGIPVVINSSDSPVERNYTNSTQKGSIQLRKVDAAQTGTTLSGARFGLYEDQNATILIAEKTTGSDGTCTFSGLEAGTYYVKEVTAPDGYQVNPNVFTFNLGPGDNQAWAYTQDVENSKRLYDLTLLKTDETGTAPLAGAQFKLEGTDLRGNTITSTSTVSGADGICRFTDLPFGEYTITEMQAPVGYALAAPFTVIIDASHTPAVYQQGQTIDCGKVTDSRTRLTVLKVDDKDPSKGLPGTKFRIQAGDQYVTAAGGDGSYTYTGLDTAGTEFVTGQNGTFVLEYLPLGSYTLVETGAPDGYILSQEKTPFTISKAEQSVTVGNTQIKAKLSLVKTDGYGKLLPGIGFTLHTGNGYVKVTGSGGAYTFAGYTDTVTADAIITTGQNGRLSVDGLLWGIYTLDEHPETTPEGLSPVTGIVFEVVADQASGTVSHSVKHGGTLELSVVNPVITGKITFKKTASDNVTGLEGAVFKLELVDGNDYSAKDPRYAVSDSSGIVSFENVPYGVYKVTEYLAPYGKTLSTEERTVTIGGSMQIYELNDWVNQDRKTSVVFKKAGTDGTALTGAIFQILDENKEIVIEKLPINSIDGETVSLPVGVYYLKETTAPSNYELNPELLEFRVTEDGSGRPIEVVMKNEPVTGSLTIVKTDKADPRKHLAGAEFKVYDGTEYALNPNTATVLYTITTNSDGTATLQNIPFGSYAVVETSAPAGYERNPNPQYFTITNVGENATTEVALEFENEPSRFILEIAKVDIVTGKPLSGARFAVYGMGFYTEVTVDETGKICVPVPAAGTYSILEIAAPEGYTVDPKVYEVTVDAHTPVGEETEAQFQSQDYPTRVRLQKVDGNDEPLEGAAFQLYRDAEEPVTFERSEDGTYLYSPGSELTQIRAGSALIEGLPAGSYVLREVEAPDGYMTLGDISFTVSEDLYDQTLSITAQNLPYKRGVAVCKENEQGIRLAGAEFTLFDEKGMILETVTTGASGYAVFSELETGSYILQETNAPAGYQINETPFSFQIDGDGVLHSECHFVDYGNAQAPFYVLTLTNTSVEYTLRLKKISAANGAALAGASFRILGSGINTVYTTGTDGLTDPISLPVGEYTLTEIQAPNGYVIDASGHHLSVGADGIEWDGEPLADKAPVILFENEPQPFRFTLVKQDASSKHPLEGAVFTVTGEDGSKATLVTDDQGRTDVISLKPGKYAVTETQAPAGYNVPLAGWSFTVEEGTFNVTGVTGGADYIYTDGVLTLTLTNERTSGSLLIYKHSASDKTKALAGAQFQVRDASNGLVWFTLRNGVYHVASSDTEGAGNVLTTNAMGQALLDGLPFGEYVVTELTAPIGYTLRSDSIQVKLTKQDETVNVDVANEQLTRKVTVYKQSAGENPEFLIGAVFALYRVPEDGSPIFLAEATTGYDGKAEFTVPYGDYTIVETRAPAGYELSETQVWSFRYNEETPEDAVFTYTFVNEKTVYDLEIRKYDAEQTDKGLAGAEFAVTNSRGYTITIKTGADGAARLENLDYDDYTIREVTAPEGYYLNEQVYTVTREQLTHGTAIRIEVPDTRILGTVLLRKVDFDDHDQLLDAEFTISDSGGQLLYWQETEDGYALSETGETVIHAGEVKLSGIPAGTYTIHEVKAPNGYLILEESRSFTVNAENAASVIEMEIENLVRKVAVGIVKMDAADRTTRLPGAEFTLYPVVNGITGTALATAVTNENGLAVFTYLTMGSYRIIETKAPYGFRLWTNSIDFIVDADGNVFMGKDQTELPEMDQIHMVGVLNTSILRELTIRKVSSDNEKPLSGATFTVTGNGKTWRVTTGTDGTAVLNLPYGEYVLQEVIAPNGYILDETRHQITVSENGISIDGAALQEFTYVLQNKPVTFAISLHKQDDTNAKPLSGAEFLISGNGVSITLKTNASGNTDTVYLQPGQYALTETKAPDGYKLPLTGWVLTVDTDGHVSIAGQKATVAVHSASVTVTVENGKKSSGGGTSSGIAKTGQIGNPTLLLSGAVMLLLSFTGLLVLAVDTYKRRRKWNTLR